MRVQSSRAFRQTVKRDFDYQVVKQLKQVYQGPLSYQLSMDVFAMDHTTSSPVKRGTILQDITKRKGTGRGAEKIPPDTVRQLLTLQSKLKTGDKVEAPCTEQLDTLAMLSMLME